MSWTISVLLIIGHMQGSWNFFILLAKNLSWKVMRNPGWQSLKRLRWGEIERPSPEIDPLNHIEKIGELYVRGVRAEQEEFWSRGHVIPPSFQRNLVGQFQGSDARFLLNQGVSDFAIWDFPITFQDKFFDNKMKKNPWSLHTAYWKHQARYGTTLLSIFMPIHQWYRFSQIFVPHLS